MSTDTRGVSKQADKGMGSETAARHHVAVPGHDPRLLLGQLFAGIPLGTSLFPSIKFSLVTDAEKVAHISRCERCQ